MGKDGGQRPQQREAALAAQWAAGVWRGKALQTEDGANYTLIYEGRRGGPAGPDFRDAVLAGADGSRLYGDSEELLTASQHLPRLEQRRIAGLTHLFERWWATGPWQPLHAGILQDDLRQARQMLLRQLQVAGGAVSPGRAAILVANVVLPFAFAWAAVHADPHLAERTLALYAALPGLPSNTITRLMTRQLRLSRLPAGAVSQLGLHHIWSTHCREKRCWECPCGGAIGKDYSGSANEPSVIPPSTTRTAPVVKSEAGDAR